MPGRSPLLAVALRFVTLETLDAKLLLEEPRLAIGRSCGHAPAHIPRRVLPGDSLRQPLFGCQCRWALSSLHGRVEALASIRRCFNVDWSPPIAAALSSRRWCPLALMCCCWTLPATPKAPADWQNETCSSIGIYFEFPTCRHACCLPRRAAPRRTRRYRLPPPLFSSFLNLPTAFASRS